MSCQWLGQGRPPIHLAAPSGSTASGVHFNAMPVLQILDRFHWCLRRPLAPRGLPTGAIAASQRSSDRAHVLRKFNSIHRSALVVVAGTVVVVVVVDVVLLAGGDGSDRLRVAAQAVVGPAANYLAGLIDLASASCGPLAVALRAPRTSASHRCRWAVPNWCARQ